MSPVRISSSTGCSGTGEKPVHAIGWQQGEAQCTLALNFALNLPDGRQRFEAAVKPVAAAQPNLGRSIAFLWPRCVPAYEPIIEGRARPPQDDKDVAPPRPCDPVGEARSLLWAH